MGTKGFQSSIVSLRLAAPTAGGVRLASMPNVPRARRAVRWRKRRPVDSGGPGNGHPQSEAAGMAVLLLRRQAVASGYRDESSRGSMLRDALIGTRTEEDTGGG